MGAFKRGTLFRVAIAMASVAVLSFVLPTVALAFVSAESVHCLIELDSSAGRQHDDNHAHHHSSGNVDHGNHAHGDVGHEPHCCGLFCVTALAPEIGQLECPPLFGSSILPIVSSGADSLMLERHFRPPIRRPAI